MTIDPHLVIALLITALFLLGLFQWRFSGRLRTITLIGMAAIVSVVVSGDPSSLVLLSLSIMLTAGTWRLSQSASICGTIGAVWISVLVACLVTVKVLNVGGSKIGFAWLGISYLIFRLIHIALEARKERLPSSLTLSETLNYALHPASLVAGPIDRIQQNVREQKRQENVPYIANGMWRVTLGIFKKVVLANLCYIFVSVQTENMWPHNVMLSTWVWLFAYSFYLYFDFAAYSDIAVGTGLLMGIRLPENFNNPYGQSDISRFWQNWHMTLTNWLRDYVYFPVSRGLLRYTNNRYKTFIALISHVVTMLVCAIWHGIGTGFLLWGIWHGLGLFAHSQFPKMQARFNLSTPPRAVNIAATFMFVTLGWVFFSTDAGTAFKIFGRLIGQ